MNHLSKVLEMAIATVLSAASSRSPRAYAEVLRLHQAGLPLAALAWAAPAKGPQWTPKLIVDELNRNSNFSAGELQAAGCAGLDLRALKLVLLEASRQARDLFATLPLEQVGYLYLDSNGRVALPNAAEVEDGSLTLHRPN